MEISIEHLNKNYGKQNVLKDISLHIPIGMYGMLGENGAGILRKKRWNRGAGYG